MADLDDHELLRRAVRMRPTPRAKTERWVHVMDMFALGSTSAKALCIRLGLDPHEKVTRG